MSLPKIITLVLSIAFSLNANALSNIECQYERSTDNSGSGVISKSHAAQTLSIQCNKALPEADLNFEEAEYIASSISCTYTIKSNGYWVQQYPGFEKRTDSHDNVTVKGEMNVNIIPKTVCVSSNYGICHETAPAPELGYRVNLKQVGGKGFEGVTFSTNKTKDLDQRIFESVNGHMFISLGTVISGTETKSIDQESKTQSLVGLELKLYEFKNVSLNRILKGINQQFSKNACTYK